MKPILEIRNISKKFMIAHERMPHPNFREKLSTLLAPRPKEEEFWALSDITFDVSAGESLGIIGRNGAGKSTLLKILSRITPPTKGRIISRGRVASLLEVGTGFHQELTGRENIFMNGSILGMRNAEIRARFDEIVEFSGTGKFLDTALKHYSSGMQLRLAFAVAAHLEPEILIIDEVLAVGDAEFQKKCLKKMEDVTHDGRTVLFVSHNLPSLKTICNKGILLSDGRLVNSGTIEEVIDKYSSFNRTEEKIANSIHYYGNSIAVHEAHINGNDRNDVMLKDARQLLISIDVSFTRRMPFELMIHIKKEEQLLASFANVVENSTVTFEPGRYKLDYKVDLPLLRSGKYKLDLFFEETFISWIAVSENIIELTIINEEPLHLSNPELKWGPVLLKGEVRRS